MNVHMAWNVDMAHSGMGAMIQHPVFLMSNALAVQTICVLVEHALGSKYHPAMSHAMLPPSTFVMVEAA